MMILEGFLLVMLMILVGRILKPLRIPMSKAEKDARTRIGGQLRRVCSKHHSYLNPGALAVLDQNNCDYCKMVREMEKRHDARG